MTITPKLRVIAYQSLGNMLAEEHRLFLDLYHSVKRSITPPFVSRLPAENFDRQINVIKRTAELFPFVEPDVYSALKDYIAEREKVLDVLSGSSSELETDERTLNEAMQEVLSKLSEAIVRNKCL